MKPLFFILSLILCLGAVGFLWRLNTENNPTPARSEASPSPLPKIEKPLATAPASHLPKAKNPKAVLPPSTDTAREKLTEFEVIDGLAIAYGDVILGKPETKDGAEITHGFYEPEIPQTWDRPVIPYAINPNLPNPKRVELALQYFAQNTPVSFTPYRGENDAIVFEPGNDQCFSALGKTGGVQPIRLSEGCGTPQIIHEIMHALGFIHEQSRTDRDQYVEVLWPNIQEKYKLQFGEVPPNLMEILKDSPFDFHSAMLYRTDAFALSPDRPTLKSKVDTAISPVPQGLSEEDIRRLNRLYHPEESKDYSQT